MYVLDNSRRNNWEYKIEEVPKTYFIVFFDATHTY